MLSGLLACAAAGACGSAPLAAATLLRGRVVHITDAATFSIATGDGRRVLVRLGGVQAPGRDRAAFGARRALARLIFDQTVEVRGEQPNGAPLHGRVLYAGLDVAMQMVAAGWLRADGSDAVLVTLEQQARAARRGLWADKAG